MERLNYTELGLIFQYFGLIDDKPMNFTSTINQ